jgi:hypothetical protein
MVTANVTNVRPGQSPAVPGGAAPVSGPSAPAGGAPRTTYAVKWDADSWWLVTRTVWPGAGGDVVHRFALPDADTVDELVAQLIDAGAGWRPSQK